MSFLDKFDLSDIVNAIKKKKEEAPQATAPFVPNNPAFSLPSFAPSLTSAAASAPPTAKQLLPVPVPQLSSINPQTPAAVASLPVPPPPQLPSLSPDTTAAPDLGFSRSVSFGRGLMDSMPAPPNSAEPANAVPIPLPPALPSFAPTVPNATPFVVPPPPISGKVNPTEITEDEDSRRGFSLPSLAPTLTPEKTGAPTTSDVPTTGRTAAWNESVRRRADDPANQLSTVAPSALDLPSLAPTLRPSEQTAAEAARIEGKKYGFQKDANGNILRDENGKPLYEKNRDTDHNWWDVVKSAGIGFARGGLPGAVGGAIGGAIDRNYDEKAIDEFKLNNLNRKFVSQVGREQAQQGYDARETQKENIKHDNRRQDEQDALKQKTGERNSLLGQIRTMKRYKHGEDPEFDARLETAGIEQPDFEPGKKQPARFWDGDGNYMTFDESGGAVPVKRADGTPVVDPSRATINVNGYSVKGRDALAATTAAGNTNTKFGNEDEQDKIKYENDVREVNAFNQGVDADIQSRRETAKNLEQANDDLRAQRAQLAGNPILNSEQIKALDQQINANTNEWRKANAEITALGGKKKPAPIAPKPRSQVATPQVNNGVKAKLDDSTIESRIRKLFPQESEISIAARVAQAKKDGWGK